MGKGFVHLHNHTDYSMLDGAARVDDLVQAAKKMGMPALGITDHGNMFGAYDFYTSAMKHEVKPIIGLEAYLTPGTPRWERKRVRFGDGTGDDVAAKGAYTHMTIWSETREGMHQLFKLASRSSLEGHFYKPRADRELLEEYHEGLIATTGCPSGEVQTYLRLGMFDKAVESAAEFQSIFGKQNFFVELMDHGLRIETDVRSDLLRLAKKLGAPLVATNDLHYVHAEDARAQDILLCVSSGSRFSDANRFKFDGTGYYLKSPEEMRTLFSNYEEACDNTLMIAERCETTFEPGNGTFMPIFPVPEGHTEESWFRHEAEEGLIRRFGSPLPREVRERADFEMDIILGKGYPGYFLIVSDYIMWAKRNGIRVGPGRGSGAGSIIAYAMGITDLDPLPYGLLFERFLNPERPSLPDFDVDFDESRRGEVLDYVTERYGKDHVAQIVTFGTIKAKQAVKDSARVLDKPFAVGEKITKAMPPAIMGKDVPLSQLFNPDHARYDEGKEFRELYEADSEVAQVVDTAKGIEGLKRQWGVHACGVIVSKVPLTDVIPIMKREQDGAIITQFEYPKAEALGLVKMDFLGLRNLTVIDDALKNIKRNTGVDVDIDAIPLDDPATFQLMQRGDTLGVFQLDGGPMRALLRSMQPDKFEDISAVSALYRPGPMGADSHNKYARRKTGREKIEPIHPELAEPLADILDETYGLIVYQEQVMTIAQKLAGYTLGAADLLRRVMGKKKKKELDAQYEVFRDGMLRRGYSQEAFQTVWDILVPFSDYAFNKSHSAAYGLVSYQTAWLKANHPVEYMAALLQSVRNEKDKSAVYLSECRRMGIRVLAPDVNESLAKYSAVGDAIRFGLGAVRNVGENIVEALIAAREEHGHFSDFHDFLANVPLVVCNKRVIESLVKAGAFDSMGHPRRGLVEIHENAIDQVVEVKRNAEHGQDSLLGGFGADPESAQTTAEALPTLDEWDKHTRLGFEREMLGLYVSDHPLNGLEHVLSAERTTTIAGLLERGESSNGSTQQLCGLITQVNRRATKKGDFWASLVVEDLDASIQVSVFPKVYERISTELTPDSVVRIKGRVNVREDSVELHADQVDALDVSADHTRLVTIQLKSMRCTPVIVERLKQVLQAHPGLTMVHLRLLDESRVTTFELDEKLRVAVSQPFIADLKALLGPSCLAV
ncbi:DNA polymerase III, alpha subunit [Propionibacterium sp. oral taxon 192 str. F0372]|uniref:DNA polymerase III subunit alpha n=1 Tax=Propionibacterium sp. oral taxon 192 TaxID=671222 RepID=UPI000352730E|nr:DNA polymerase III subunit alpha [Propionibacterium sp. oral taxon 192]EPH02731.1 DNA polymerase III, alpha subunit [Propionibacterium sp. oral taxon 192 str. F0372]